MAKQKAGALPVWEFALQDWRSCTSVLWTMSANEIRKALAFEWRPRQRRTILKRLTSRLCILQKRDKVAEIHRILPPKRRRKAALLGDATA